MCVCLYFPFKLNKQTKFKRGHRHSCGRAGIALVEKTSLSDKIFQNKLKNISLSEISAERLAYIVSYYIMYYVKQETCSYFKVVTIESKPFVYKMPLETETDVRKCAKERGVNCTHTNQTTGQLAVVKMALIHI